MHQIVLSQTGQGLNETDIARLGQFPQKGIERTTRDLLTSGLCYSGFLTTKSDNDSVNVTIAVGDLYDGGKQYVSEAIQTRSVADYVPTIAGKSVICLIVAQGQESPDFLENRYYERPVDPANPSAGTLLTVDDGYRVSTRRAILTVIPGVEATRPVAPIAPTGSVAVADILITTSGIQDVTMRTDTAAKRLDLVAAQQAAIVVRLDLIDQAVAGFRADLAAVAASLLSSASVAALNALQQDVALIKESLDLPDDGSPYWADRFLDYGETDWDPITQTGNVDFNARTAEGIRFAYDAASEFALSLYNPNDPNLALASAGLICPKFTAVPGIILDAATGDMPLGGVSVQTITVEHLTQSRQRVRYGTEYTVCNNAAWWNSGKFDPIAGIFTSAAGETYQAAAELFSYVANGGAENDVNHQAIRIRQFWKDEIEVPYDKYTPNQITISGVVKAESFLQHQERWVVGTDLAIKRWGDGAQIKAVLVECDASGRPDPTRVLATSTLTSADFKVWPQWTPFNLPKPIFTSPLGAGGRARPYAVMWFTTGDVDVMTADGGSFLGGNLFTTTDGVYFDGDLTKDICFRVRYAKFDFTDIPIRLGSWNLSGGIESIDVLAPMVVPGSASATFQVNVGGNWRSLAADESGSSFLNGTQALYDARILLNGTEWSMPIIDTANSRVRLARPKAAFDWIGKAWTIGSNATEIKVKAVVASWDAARHVLAAKLRHGTGFASVKNAAAAPTVRVVPGREVARPTQEYAVEMEWTFSFTGSPVGAVKPEFVGSTNNYKVPFHIEWAVARKTV